MLTKRQRTNILAIIVAIVLTALCIVAFYAFVRLVLALAQAVAS